MYELKAGRLQLALSQDARTVVWSAEGLLLEGTSGADFWRLYIDDGEYRDIPVHSRRQKGKIEYNQSSMNIIYEGLVAEDGRTFDVQLVVHVMVNSCCLHFNATIENADRIRVNEIKLPFVDLAMAANKSREKDVLYRSQHLGERIENPWTAIEQGHTEYMCSDHHEIWMDMKYPSPASMAWQGIASGGYFLYMGRHDELFRSCVFAVGKGPRGSEPRLILTVSHFPLVNVMEKETTAPVVLSLEEGDWRKGAAIYRKWADQTFWHNPVKPLWVKELSGWQRIILKHQYGEILFKYNDLPRLYMEGKKAGLDMLLVFGWWRGCFDNSYPVYEPDPALGGKQGLIDAIVEIHHMGGRVALYTNGVLIDVKSDYYREKGYRICRKDIDGNEYREHYRFGNDGMLLRNYGYKSFVSACQSTPEWKEQLMETGRMKLEYNPDSIFFDQIGGHFPLICFDQSHAHGTRGDREAVWRRENLKALRKLCTADKALGTEFVVDVTADCAHYLHNVWGGEYRKNSYPELFLSTFPEVVTTNRDVNDNNTGFKSKLNFAFVYGLRYCVSLYRCRAGVSAIPEYAEYLSGLLKLREKYAEFFYHGRFVVETDMELPEGVIKTEYVNGDKRLFVFWNNSKQSKVVYLKGRVFSLMPDEINCEEL